MRLAHCPEWRFGDSHSPVGLAELACLPGFVARTFLTKIASYLHYPHTYAHPSLGTYTP